MDRGVDSLIFNCRLSNENLYRFGMPQTPRALVDRVLPASGLTTVGADFTEGARTATMHLVGHGHRRIAYMGGPLFLPHIDLRRQAWDDVIHELGLPRIPPAITAWNREGGYRAALDLLERADPPTAIFAASDFMAIGALRAIHKRGLRIPEDIAVVSFDGTAESSFSWPPLTTVRQPFEEMARKAVDTLADTPEEVGHTVFPMELIVRESCGCGL